MKKKVAFYTLGCKLNYSETSTIGRIFQERGFEKVEFTDTPDIYVINTCSVTDNADKKCRKIVKEAQKYSPNAFITIVGCYAQLNASAFCHFRGRSRAQRWAAGESVVALGSDIHGTAIGYREFAKMKKRLGEDYEAIMARTGELLRL